MPTDLSDEQWSIRWACLLTVVVTSATNADDGTAAPRLLQRVDEQSLPRLSVIFGDNKYNNKSLRRWMEQEHTRIGPFGVTHFLYQGL